MPYLPRSALRCITTLKHLLCLFLVNLVFSLHAQADDQGLMDAVQQFLYQETQTLGQEVMIDISPPSPHLPACVSPDPFFPNANQSPLGRVSVGVRCGEASRQVRYMQAQIAVIGKYVVAGQDIDRGTLITRDMLSHREGNLGDLAAQALTQQDEVVGLVAQRAVRAGSTFQAHFLKAPQVVRRGERVTVIAQGAGFRVSREGEALADGAQGERIRVRFDTRELVTARIVGQGTLVIDF